MKVHDLEVKYGQTSIVKNVNFSLDGHMSILGCNGSGKSTLAKALCGLLPYDGSITIETDELREMSNLTRARKVVYIPSKLESFEKFTTVEEFVLFARFAYKESFKDYTNEDREIVKEVLQELGIQTLQEQNISNLSSGQQQLVLIAQALAQKPELIIFDEPTSNLDPANSALFVKELKKVRENHKTILITHDINLAAHLDDPVLFIKENRATLYEKSFFESSFLSFEYGIKFLKEDTLIGVAYE